MTDITLMVWNKTVISTFRDDRTNERILKNQLFENSILIKRRAIRFHRRNMINIELHRLGEVSLYKWLGVTRYLSKYGDRSTVFRVSPSGKCERNRIVKATEILRESYYRPCRGA